VKFNPLANWGQGNLDAYAAEHQLPAHPLVAQGFPSIGCWPCTQPAEEGEDVRAGRWKGMDKVRVRLSMWRVRRGRLTNVGGDI
jgi:phosphoadenosine phosphosulfate reductase